MKRTLFYALSLSWGLPLTLCGAVTVGVLALRGYPVKRFGPLFYVEVGELWGGLELGLFFLTEKNGSPRIRLHEAGHSIQNLLYGPFMPLLISIPSAIRYHLRRRAARRGHPPRHPYDGIWFERQATAWGHRFFAHL